MHTWPQSDRPRTASGGSRLAAAPSLVAAAVDGAPHSAASPMASICQHFPLLVAWAHALARLELWWCHAQEHEECGDPAAIADAWCASPGAALRLRLSLAVAALLLAAAAAALFWRLVRVGLGSQSERAVAAAIAALKEMRKAEAAAAEGPPARHMFTRLPADDVPVDPLNPLLCSVCGCGIGPGAGGLPAALQCCAACGLVVHDGCARRAGKTCRPLCCAGPRLPHFWQAKGTVLEEPEVRRRRCCSGRWRCNLGWLAAAATLGGRRWPRGVAAAPAPGLASTDARHPRPCVLCRTLPAPRSSTASTAGRLRRRTAWWLPSPCGAARCARPRAMCSAGRPRTRRPPGWQPSCAC